MAAPSDNLFIGDLPGDVSEQLVRDVFAAYGTVVSIKVMPKPDRSAALVKFGSVDQAQWVHDNLNGNLAEGLEQPIVVQYSRSGGKGGKGGERGAVGVAAAPTWGPPAVSPSSGKGGDAASDNLFIGDLPGDVSEQLVRDVFSAYGKVVSIKVMPKPDRSAALVKFGSVDEAQWVHDNLNGNLAGGLEQPIVVQYSRSGGKGGKGGERGAGGGAVVPTWGAPAVSPSFGGGGDTACDNLFIGDLPPDITDEALKDVFSSYGKVVSCKAITKPGGERGAGLVRFGNADEAQWVKDNLHGNIPEGLDSPVVVKYSRSGTGGGGGGCKGKGGGGSYGAVGQPWDGAARAAPYPPSKGAKGGGKGPSGADFRSLLSALTSNGAVPRGRRPDENCLHIKNLPVDTMDVNLYELCAPFGGIQGVKAMIKEDGSCSGQGFVDFQDPKCAGVAVAALDGQALSDGNVLGVNIKRARKGGGKGDKLA